jgi:hypothetical protein
MYTGPSVQDGAIKFILKKAVYNTQLVFLKKKNET